jgi:AraC-like DNA-binding protein
MNVEYIYSFEPSVNRNVIIANHMFYTIPESHPDRLLDIHDVFYVIDGQESVYLEDIEYFINPGDVMLLPGKYRHYGKRLYKPDTHAMYIHFSMEKNDHMIQEKEVIETDAIVMPVFIHTYNHDIFDHFQAIAKVYLSNSNNKALRCSSLLNLLLIELSENSKQSMKRNAIVDDILMLLHNHPQKFYTIHELVKYSGICTKSLTSHFKSVTGQSVHKYQMNSKLDQIATLLKNHTFSNLKVLAQNFGFYDEFHLSSCFKKKFNISPIRYSNM